MIITEIITGPMFCGKSEELIRRLVRARFANKKILLLKPEMDDRSERDVFQLVKENKNLRDYAKLTLAKFSSSLDFKELLKIHKPQAIAIDEAQFIEDPRFLGSIKELQHLKADNEYGISDLKIIISGLDMDFEGNEFNQMPVFLAIADRVDKLTGICVVCGDDKANMTYRLPSISKDKILVGGSGTYQIRCRKCHKLSE